MRSISSSKFWVSSSSCSALLSQSSTSS
ncbi:hypothetical protein F383_33837 [Gossypium arboreum]|uniref:Uncharacterized protein n=1 Tax=Gossypium arboreum TaxID=29729 RepID=A0A0B0N7K3_GOSAR|nr:hypothetical protein F383_33837 [Gossypium arboreum]